MAVVVSARADKRSFVPCSADARCAYVLVIKVMFCKLQWKAWSTPMEYLLLAHDDV
jgi:hypothetical protein